MTRDSGAELIGTTCGLLYGPPTLRTVYFFRQKRVTHNMQSLIQCHLWQWQDVASVTPFNLPVHGLRFLVTPTIWATSNFWSRQRPCPLGHPMNMYSCTCFRLFEFSLTGELPIGILQCCEPPKCGQDSQWGGVHCMYWCSIGFRKSMVRPANYAPFTIFGLNGSLVRVSFYFPNNPRMRIKDIAVWNDALYIFLEKCIVTTDDEDNPCSWIQNR
jgi:hypothetical protein